MPEPRDYHLGADVHSSDGRHIGTLQRLVVGADSLDVRELIVKESKRFSGRLLAPGSALMVDELVVPVSDIAELGRDRIVLGLTAEDARLLPPYLTYHYAPTAEFPSAVSSLLGGSPYVPKLVEEAAEAPGELELEAGENVMLGRTGKKLGEVKDVLVDDGQLVGVVVHRGLFARDVILPRRLLDRSDDAALFAQLTEADLEHLQPFEPAE
jgi:sporulation protein YlmC with PRC-barrel domain